ncbi:cytochrome P450 [Nocardia sp. SYP-A9097]|uniref:cytochrome P450 n=1 Tax=Nocardia sp. SYP-A9097 TaxID=2663237 RepID=UPI00129C0FE0|nr:cytochrome P450 [Nocardia sp. SYP-A9097]MRH88597.1 cytochrome P450 [Nocardia sp. SYP-A9097]
MTELSTSPVESTDSLPTIPRGRTGVFELPTGLMGMADAGPIHRLRYAGGHIGWIVTDFELCRKVLTMPEFSSRPDLRHSAIHEAIGDGQPPEERPGMFVGMDPPDHTHYRRIVAAALRLGEMRKLQASITDRANALFDACTGETIDLVGGVASPLPALVITELLGVEEAVSHILTTCLESMLSLESTADEVRQMFGTIFDELGEVVSRRQQDHAPGFITNMIEDGQLSHAEMTSVAFQLYTAGHETTTNMIALSWLHLLENPEAARGIRGDDDDAIANAMEEYLRFFSIIQYGISRAALREVELGGVVIQPGETITVSLPAANFDGGRFPDPHILDIARRDRGHLAFGFGVHQCVAQQLARVELTVALRVFLERYDGFALDSYEMKADTIVHGLTRLSVRRSG